MTDSVDEREEKQQELVRLLAGIEFGRRYYAFYDARPVKKGKSSLTGAELAAALAETWLGFKYQSRGRFFSHKESNAGVECYMNVQLELSMAELIMGFNTAKGWVGGPFHGLAARCENLRMPGTKHEPEYPRLPFVTGEDLREVMKFGIDLFVEARNLVAAQGWG